MTLPEDSQSRKNIPMARGLLDYFPAALAEVARLSQIGNDKHNPGEPLHHARNKSMDHADCIMRHLAERGTPDTDGLSHSVKVAWRALALLQEELEAHGAPLARGARGGPWLRIKYGEDERQESERLEYELQESERWEYELQESERWEDEL